MKALVTGAAGFVGRHLCPKLGAAGYELGTLDPRRLKPRGSSFSGFTIEDFLQFVPKAEYDVIVHLAANIVNVDARMKMGLAAFDDMALDLQFLKWVEQNPPTRALVLMSSCAVDYPEDPYCIVKRNLEAMAKVLVKKGVPVIVLRPFSGYGEDQSPEYPFRAILERALRKEDPLTVWGGSQVRDWIHIDDLTDAILFAIEKAPKDARPIEVGTGIGTSVQVLAAQMAFTCGYQPIIFHDREKPSSSKRRVAGDRGANQLLNCYGWEQKISLEEGVRRAVAARQKEAAIA